VADYYPFGKILREWAPCQIERYLTTYHERDKASGYDYRGARFYDSDLGRFVSVDPLAEDFVYLTTYQYASNDPIANIDLDGLEGMHFMETLGNGSKRHVIEKNIIVLTKAPKAIPSGASSEKVEKIKKQNERRARSNEAKVAAVESELNNFFNGGDGQAMSSNGEAVRFQFNVTGMEVENTNGFGTPEEAREVAIENGVPGGKPPFDGAFGEVAPAAIVTTKPTLQSRTDKISIEVDDTAGATAHEVGHTLMRNRGGQRAEESKPGSGGLMTDPPGLIKASEVDKMLENAVEKKN